MRFAPALLLLPALTHAQIIEFESAGLKYKALTHGGVTIMFATLPRQVHGWAIQQVSISNGSPISWAVRPEDFIFERADGQVIRALPANEVVQQLMAKAGAGDVIKLVTAYEAGLYGNTQMHSTNGYEARREGYLAQGGGSNKLKAAAAASAIALVTTKISPGQSTDGAVFYPSQGKPLGAGKLIVNAAGEVFEFPVEAETKPR